MMKFKIAVSAMLMATVSPIAMSQEQGLMPDAIPGGDQFEANCLALFPGGDQFQNAIRQIDDELPEGIPGGDQFNRNAIPGGDQFEPYQIPGGDQFVRSCFEGFQDVGLLIPGGDQFDPQALERLALGEIELSPALIEPGLRIDRSAAQQIANGGGLGIDGFIRPNSDLSTLLDEDLIPGGDQFGPIAPSMDPLKIDDELPEGDVVPVPVPAGCDWTGSWSSTYGILKLVQNGTQVSGDYSTKGFIKGTVGPGCNLKGTFDNRQEQIKGTYEFTRDDETFEGLWGLEGELPYEAWKGRRSSSELPKLRAEERWTTACQWTGTWFTPSAGVRMRLVQDGARVIGEIGDNLIVEGNTETACEGRRDVRMEAKVTDRDTGADQSMTITMSSGGQRYGGTLGGLQQGQPVSIVFAGSRASRERPQLALIQRSPESAVSDAGGTASAVTATPPRTYARWEVSLGKVCMVQTSEEYDWGRISGIIWVKARVYDKTSAKEVLLEPVGGFKNLNGDQERVWEFVPGDYGNDTALTMSEGECRSFSDIGISTGEPIKLTFEIDPLEYGYQSIDELMDRRRNRIRVMYKLDRFDITQLTGINIVTDIKPAVVDQFGTQPRTHALAEADFCGSCNLDDWKSDQSLRLYGSGLFTRVRDDDGFELALGYDIKRLPDLVK